MKIDLFQHLNHILNKCVSFYKIHKHILIKCLRLQVGVRVFLKCGSPTLSTPRSFEGFSTVKDVFEKR